MAHPNPQNVRKPMSYAQAANQSKSQEKRKPTSPAPLPPPSKRVEHPKDSEKELPSFPTVSQETGKSKASGPVPSSNPSTQDQDNDATKDLPDTEPSTTTQIPPQPTPTLPKLTLTLTHHNGSLFAAPPTTVLIHACNILGSWGAGIALAFRNSYPNAYKRYRAHCVSAHDPKTNPVMTGTCLLIPPCEGPSNTSAAGGGRGRGGGRGVGRGGRGVGAGQGAGNRTGAGNTTGSETVEAGPPKQHWIACLFTSARYGKARDSPEQILAATGPAMRDLLRQVAEQRRQGKAVGGLRMCKINSGLFGVKWERTVEVLEGIEVEAEGDGQGSVEVWSMD